MNTLLMIRELMIRILHYACHITNDGQSQYYLLARRKELCYRRHGSSIKFKQRRQGHHLSGKSYNGIFHTLINEIMETSQTYTWWLQSFFRQIASSIMWEEYGNFSDDQETRERWLPLLLVASARGTYNNNMEVLVQIDLDCSHLDKSEDT